jgi:POT family proton-dependent oligopeptide transporter
MTDAAAEPRAQTDLFGHPKGLWVLAGTELWERISFHGMQAMLTLYMAGELLLPGRVEHVVGFARYRAIVEGVTGPLSSQALATQTFGLYVGLIYFTPVFGGMIGDRWIGRRASVILGGLLMTMGHFCLAFDQSFLLALLLLILGAGLLRGNLSAQVKSLYADGDRREADAFQVYYLGINFGAFIAPIATGALAAVYGWHVGFAFAGFGMLVGLVFYLLGQRHLPADARRAETVEQAGALTADERRRVLGLLAIWPIGVCFWLAQSQVWNVYNLWVRDHVDLNVGGFVVPVPWLQALDGLAPALLTPVVILFWRWQAGRKREPDLYVKLAIGCLIFAAGVVWLALAPLVSGADGRAPLLWPVAFHVISNLGAVYYAPVVLALFAAQAPARLRGTLIGVNSHIVALRGARVELTRTADLARGDPRTFPSTG